MLLRANVLLRPTSGVRPELVDALVAMLNAGRRAAGAGAGKRRRQRRPGAAEPHRAGADGRGRGARRRRAPSRRPRRSRAAGLRPFRFAPKEGLAFINGTQAQTALLALLVHDAEVLWRTAVGAAAMSLEALRGTPAPLDPRIHEARPHRGQLEAAALMRALLADSEIRESHRENDPRVQDAYSLRCAPQVLGAVADAIRFAEETVDRRAQRLHRQPAGVSRRRGDLGRELPRPAGGPGARLPGDRRSPPCRRSPSGGSSGW